MLLTGYNLNNKILFYVALSAIVFGAINISVANIATAQNPETSTSNTTTDSNTEEKKDIIDVVFENFLTQMLPLVGGFVTIGVQFARNQGLKISGEAEEYLVKSTKSFVENQSRLIYKEIRSDPITYGRALAEGRVPKDLGKKALENAKSQLVTELKSDEFTRTARKMLTDNLDALVERFVTENNKEIATKTKIMLDSLVPIAVNAALLPFKNLEDAQKEKDKIIQDVLKTIEKNFDYENMLFSNDIAEMHIKSELNKLIGSIKPPAQK